jgi:hypothetical protein
VRGGEQIDLLRNEMAGLMKSKPDQRQMVIEEMLVISEAHGGIKSALKELKGPKVPIKIDSKMIALAAVSIVGLLVVYYKWDAIGAGVAKFQVWLSVLQNQLLFLATLGILSATIIFGWRRARK